MLDAFSTAQGQTHHGQRIRALATTPKIKGAYDMTKPVRALAAHEIEFFGQNGFLTLDRITTDDELVTLRAIYDRLFDERAGWDEGAQFDLGGNEQGQRPRLPQLLGPSKYAPELANTQFLANARAIARQLLGDDLIEEYGEHMIFKPAKYGAATPWHQDQAYHDPALRFRNINFWMPLDDATVESGCMQFVPGSHCRDVLPHHSIGDDPAVHGLEVDDPDQHAGYAVACPVPAGGLTMHAAYTLHYAGPNTSASPRRAYILVFRAPPTKRREPVDNYWMREKQTARMARAARAASASAEGARPTR